ncbi:MAG: hypothetical protein HQM01_09830, partial [Magnetococcales bacterium]|nr:hypothetical protein [Magnetococcales bacterium]
MENPEGNRALPVGGTVKEVWWLLRADGKAMVGLVWPWLMAWLVVETSSRGVAWLLPGPFSDKGLRDLLEMGSTIGAFLITVPVSTVLMRWAVEGSQSRVTVGARELLYVKYSIFLLLLIATFGALAFIFIKMAIPYYY